MSDSNPDTKELGTPVKPVYRKVAQDDGKATQLYLIACDEGWRESIVCTDMYGWAADWLIGQIQGRAICAWKTLRLS